MLSYFTMRGWIGLPAVRMLRWHVLSRYNNEVFPLKSIFGSAHFLMKYKISSGFDSLSSFGAHFSRNLSCSCNYFTVSSHESTCNSVNSSESSADNNTVDSSAVCQQLPLALIKEIYNEVMTAPKWLTNSEWSAFGKKFDEERLFSVLWPTLLLNLIAHKTEAVPGLYDVGMSLVDYVASLSERHRLLRLVSCIAICIHQGGEDYYEKALALYDELCAEYGVFDHMSAHILIVALAKTRYWRRCLELIDMMKITADASSSDYSAIIVAAMANQDCELANRLLETLARNGWKPDDKVFLHMCANGPAELVLTILKDFAWIPSRPVMESLISKLERYAESCSYGLWSSLLKFH